MNKWLKDEISEYMALLGEKYQRGKKRIKTQLLIVKLGYLSLHVCIYSYQFTHLSNQLN